MTAYTKLKNDQFILFYLLEEELTATVTSAMNKALHQSLKEEERYIIIDFNLVNSISDNALKYLYTEDMHQCDKSKVIFTNLIDMDVEDEVYDFYRRYPELPRPVIVYCLQDAVKGVQKGEFFPNAKLDLSLPPTQDSAETNISKTA